MSFKYFCESVYWTKKVTLLFNCIAFLKIRIFPLCFPSQDCEECITLEPSFSELETLHLLLFLIEMYSLLSNFSSCLDLTSNLNESVHS